MLQSIKPQWLFISTSWWRVDDGGWWWPSPGLDGSYEKIRPSKSRVSGGRVDKIRSTRAIKCVGGGKTCEKLKMAVKTSRWSRKRYVTIIQRMCLFPNAQRNVERRMRLGVVRAFSLRAFSLSRFCELAVGGKEPVNEVA